jgi:hypothetical protein
MKTCSHAGAGWTATLRRRPLRIVEGQQEGGFTATFEIICRTCGDHPYLDYREVSPRLRLIRGPYPLEAGITAYEEHLKFHQTSVAPDKQGTCVSQAG